MNTHRSTWTRLDLELYHDDALDRATADRLTEALRETPDLRRRLSEVARTDALARAALSRPAPARSPMPPRWAALLGAAVVIIALAGTILLVRPAAAPPAPPTPVADAPREGHPRESMIVFSFPIPKQTRDPAPAPTPQDAVVAVPPAPPPPEAPAASRADAALFVASLDSALARGDASAAAELLAASNADLRTQGYRRLGTVLRSVTTARRVLGELPVDGQLAACRELALEPRWRTVTCSRLTTLREDAATRAAVEALLDELARSPDLAPLVQRVRTSRPSAPASGRSI